MMIKKFDGLNPAMRNLNGRLGRREQNGHGGSAAADQPRGNFMVAGFFAFLAGAAQMPAAYVNIIREQTALLPLAESLRFKSAHHRDAAIAFSDIGAAGRLSPEVEILVGEHQKAYATLAWPPSTTTCR